MTDDAHDVCLIPLFINGVEHGFSVYGETFVLFTVEFVPTLQGQVEMPGINTDTDIAKDGLTGDDITAVFVAAIETFPRLGAKAFGPIRDSPISAHPTEDCPGCNSQNCGKLMATSFPRY